MVTLDSRVRLVSDVFARQFDDEVVLVHLRRGDYFGLDAVGARVWSGLVEGQTIREVARAMVTEYAVDASILEADLTHLVEELVIRGLVIVEEP
jgi:hypothetical protein